MERSFHLHTIRNGCALVIALALLFSWTLPAAAQAQQGITLTVSAGYDQRCKENTWIPVRVTLSNSGANLSGRVEVRINNYGSGSVVYSKPVELPSGSKKELELTIFPQGYVGNLEVFFNDGRSDIASAQSTLNCSSSSGLLVGVLASSSTPFNALADINPSAGNAVIAPMVMSDLPENSQALRSLDVLVFSDIDTGALTPAQRDALKAWVSSGGQLIVAGGPGWQKTSAGLLDVLPLAPSQAVTLDSLEGMAQIQVGALQGQALAESAVAAVGQPAEDAQVLAQQGETPLVLKRLMGAGAVYYLAADPTLPPLRNWDQAGDFYRFMLSAQPDQPGWAYGFRNWAFARSAITAIPTLDLPSAFLVCGLLFVYVMVAGPLNYLVLQKLKRRELAWISLPVLVVVFSGLTFLMGNLIRGNTPILHRLAVVEVSPGSQVASVHGLVGLFSPVRGTYTLQIGSGFLPHPMPTDSLAGEDWALQEGSAETLIDSLRVEVGGIRALAVDGYTAAPAVSSDLTLKPGSVYTELLLEGTLTNNSDLTFSGAKLLIPGDVMDLGDLKPGESRNVSMAVYRSQFAGLPILAGTSGSAPAPSTGIYIPAYGATSNDTTIEDINGESYYSDKESYRRYNLLAAALNLYSDNSGRGGGIYLSGWVESSPIAAQLIKKRFTTLDSSLYLIRIQPALDLGQDTLVLPAGLFTWRAESTSSYGTVSPYDAYFNSGNTITFDFKLAHAISYRQVQALYLNLDTDTSGSVPNQVMEVQLWDYTQSAYITVPNIQWGENVISDPQRFVGPGGQIRVFLDGSQSGLYSAFHLTQADFTLKVEQ